MKIQYIDINHTIYLCSFVKLNFIQLIPIDRPHRIPNDLSQLTTNYYKASFTDFTNFESKSPHDTKTDPSPIGTRFTILICYITIGLGSLCMWLNCFEVPHSHPPTHVCIYKHRNKQSTSHT